MTTDPTTFATAAARILAVLAMLRAWGSAAQIATGLSYEFYDQTCPQYESIIAKAITSALQANPLQANPLQANPLQANPAQAAGLSRIHYHDCFIQVNGPSIKVPVGRRDGISMAPNQTVLTGIPPPVDNVTQMIPIFSKQGLSYTDLVALSGAHTLGYARCTAFSNRLSPTVDPNMNADLAKFLIQTCTNQPTTLVSQDQTPNKFDNNYFTRMVQGAVLLTSDADLNLNTNTVPVVKQFAGDGATFSSQFEISFLKLSQLNVLTGSSGQIRKICSAINL